MGAGGASAFLSQLEKNPLNIAADIFPKEARANRGVFYVRATGQPKTLQQVYDFFDKKFSGDTAVASAPETMAHKPSKKSDSGYQHIPFSMKKPVEVREANYQATMNSLYQFQSQLDAFFATPTKLSGSLYGDLKSPSSVLLDILR